MAFPDNIDRQQVARLAAVRKGWTRKGWTDGMFTQFVRSKQRYCPGHGRVIADRPPYRSVQAELPHTVLPWMSGVETHVRKRMQDTGTRYPSFEGRADARPSGTAALTATAKHRPPEIAQ